MSPSQVNALELLRPLMESHSPPLHALVVPSEDYHQVSCISFLMVFYFFSVTWRALGNWFGFHSRNWCALE